MKSERIFTDKFTYIIVNECLVFIKREEIKVIVVRKNRVISGFAEQIAAASRKSPFIFDCKINIVATLLVHAMVKFVRLSVAIYIKIIVKYLLIVIKIPPSNDYAVGGTGNI